MNDKTTDSERPYVGLESIEPWTGRLIEVGPETAGEGLSNLFEIGDVLFGKLRPYLAKVHRAQQAGRCTSELLVLRPRDVTAEFLQYLMLAEPFISLVNSSTFGAKMPRAEWEFIGRVVMPCPPLPAQRAIAAFLDRKTAAIDALLEKKTALLNLLDEQRRVVLDRVLMGREDGDPSDGAPIMLQFGQVPSGWEVWTVRDLLRMRLLEVQDGNHGELHPVADDYVDSGIPFLMANNVRNGAADLDCCRFIPKALADRLRIGFAKGGDVLLTHKGTVGEVAHLPTNLPVPYVMLTPQVTYYRPLTPRLLPRFLFFFFQSPAFQQQLDFLGSLQSTRDYVGIIAQRNLRVLLPPIETQRQLCAAAEAHMRKFDGARQLLDKQVRHLKDMRQGLIVAAVTGQIEVTRDAA